MKIRNSNLVQRKEVINLLAGGNNYQQIADQLFISVDTVRHHIKNIYKKLHVHTQSEAVAKAIRKKSSSYCHLHIYVVQSSHSI